MWGLEGCGLIWSPWHCSWWVLDGCLQCGEHMQAPKGCCQAIGVSAAKLTIHCDLFCPRAAAMVNLYTIAPAGRLLDPPDAAAGQPVSWSGGLGGLCWPATTTTTPARCMHACMHIIYVAYTIHKHWLLLVVLQAQWRRQGTGSSSGGWQQLRGHQAHEQRGAGGPLQGGWVPM